MREEKEAAARHVAEEEKSQEEQAFLDLIEETLKELPGTIACLTEEIRLLREAIEKALEVWTKIG